MSLEDKMSLKDIAEEIIDREVQEKKRSIDKIRSSLRAKYMAAALYGAIAAAEGIATAAVIREHGPELAITMGPYPLASACISVYCCRKIADKYKQIRRAEEELKLLTGTYEESNSIE